MSPGLTDAERIIMRSIRLLVAEFHDLPDHHPSDLADFVFHVHAIQNLMAFRVSRRVDPDEWWQPEPAPSELERLGNMASTF